MRFVSHYLYIVCVVHYIIVALKNSRTTFQPST
ncbi:hypothetical protein [PinkBerry-associated phage LS06-2018-MD08]|nr:hypothetical protein [PinkBerry-associated phage LS06-2018-MD08]